MRHSARKFIWMLALSGILSAAGAAGLAGHSIHQSASASPKSLADGPALFQAYCAFCHGELGKGDGSLADFLSRPPIDLTTIALKHGGTFPALWVEDFIADRGRGLPPGRDAMPDWGRFLRSTSPSQAVYRLKLWNLVQYIRSIQVN